MAIRTALLKLGATVRPTTEIPEKNLAAYIAHERERLRVLESPTAARWRIWGRPPT